MRWRWRAQVDKEIMEVVRTERQAQIRKACCEEPGVSNRAASTSHNDDMETRLALVLPPLKYGGPLAHYQRGHLSPHLGCVGVAGVG